MLPNCSIMETVQFNNNFPTRKKIYEYLCTLRSYKEATDVVLFWRDI